MPTSYSPAAGAMSERRTSAPVSTPWTLQAVFDAFEKTRRDGAAAAELDSLGETASSQASAERATPAVSVSVTGTLRDSRPVLVTRTSMASAVWPGRTRCR
ncbi:hypothetical protein GCM10029992_33420 [Glycomyces albus]